MGKPTSAIGFNTIYGWTKFNADGTVSFGTTNEAEERYAVLLKNNEQPIHKFEMFNKGANKGRTHIHAPKGMSLVAGLENEKVAGSMLIQSHHGNITIDCQDGDFLLKARNITLEAAYGEDKKQGNLVMKSTNKMLFDGGSLMEQFAKEQISITSNNILRLHGVIQTQMISGIAQMTSWSSIAGKLPLLAPPTAAGAAAIASAQLSGLGKAWPGTREEAEQSGAGVGASKPSTNADIQAGIKQHAGAAAANAATAAKGQGGAS